jgi:hypothetical protein
MMYRFKDKVLLVFHPFVLHPTSEVATQAAWCAGFINETCVVGTRSEGELVALIRQE